MLQRFRDRFGTAGLIVAVVALVAALAGTAIAAGALTPTQKKEVKKIAKKYAGKQGPTGPLGPQGAPGAAGANGTNGVDGANGADGEDGTNGTNGKSVTVGTATSEECSDGGTTVQVEGNAASKKAICNGAEGATGPAGPTETTLPPGKTITGNWSFGSSINVFGAFATINFPLKVSPAPKVRWMAEGAAPTEKCPGAVNNPKAAPGNVCIYVSEIKNSDDGKGIPNGLTEGASGSAYGPDFTAGLGFEVQLKVPTEEAYGFGSWAVTACPASEPTCS